MNPAWLPLWALGPCYSQANGRQLGYLSPELTCMRSTARCPQDKWAPEDQGPAPAQLPPPEALALLCLQSVSPRVWAQPLFWSPPCISARALGPQILAASQSEGCKFKVKVSQGGFLLRPLPWCVDGRLFPVSPQGPSVCVCAPISPFAKDTRPVGLGPIPTTSF